MNKPKAVAHKKLMPVKVCPKVVLIPEQNQRLPARHRAVLSVNWETALNILRLAAVRAKTITHARTSTFVLMWDPRGKARARVKGSAKNPVTLPVADKKKVVAKARHALSHQVLALVRQVQTRAETSVESVDA